MKNRIIMAVLAIGLIAIVWYSFKSSVSFEVQKFTEQQVYKKDMIEMENSPLKDSSIIRFFKPNESFKLDARFKKNKKNSKVNMTDSSVEEVKEAGTLLFTFKDQEYKVVVFEEGEPLMLPFKDKTNGSQTYGGGRYLNINKVMEDKVVLDFNDARNFYCTYSKDFVCPIPPKENNLPFEIIAGEMNVKP